MYWALWNLIVFDLDYDLTQLLRFLMGDFLMLDYDLTRNNIVTIFNGRFSDA